MDINTKLTLNNGVEMPILGLGVYQSAAGEECESAVLTAFELGYRHVDSAAIYRNEESVGAAVRKSGIPREELFITTKLWNSDQGYKKTIQAMDSSLRKLGLDYVDLYLMHWPVENLRIESWKAMEELLAAGKCRAIGVSNFMVRHLEELAQHSEVTPAANQFELHPFNGARRAPELAYCADHGIVVQAYSPLVKAQRFGNPVVASIAQRLKKTEAQILLRWSIQKGVVTLPKSVRPHRIRENSEIFDFELSPQNMAALDGLNEPFTTSWDPTDAP